MTTVILRCPATLEAIEATLAPWVPYLVPGTLQAHRGRVDDVGYAWARSEAGPATEVREGAGWVEWRGEVRP